MEQESKRDMSLQTREERYTQYKPVDKSVRSSVVDLTDDAWLLVFSKLGTEDRIRVARVSTRWKELARISWKFITRLSFKEMKESLIRRSKIVEDCLEKCGPRLQCLDLSTKYQDGFNGFIPHFLDLVDIHGASLQGLNLSYNKVDNTTLKALAERLPRLRSLSLFCCSNINEDGLRSALKTLQSLKSLNVSGLDDRITGYSEFFSQAPQSLTEVLVSHSKNLTDESVRILAERCPNLEAIDISRSGVSRFEPINTSTVTGQSIRHIVKNCPKLWRLTCYDSFRWDESTFATLFKLPLLEELHVTAEDAVTDQLFCELSIHCPRLTSISLPCSSNLTDAAFSHLCPWLHLENINFLSCPEFTDIGFNMFSSAHPKLKKVNLEGCCGITYEGVGQLVLTHPNLLELNFTRTNKPRLLQKLLPILQLNLQRREHSKLLNLIVWFDFPRYMESAEKKALRVFTEKTVSKCIVYNSMLWRHTLDDSELKPIFHVL